MTASETAGRNLVITGFMGTGKSAVAQRVAAALGRLMVDMDAEIERRAGMSIPDIFAQQGEAAFRRLEAELCRELAARNGLVIATGGGTLVAEENREILGCGGDLFCLDCAPQELLRRLDGDDGRPMLWGEDRAARLRNLLATRRPAYAAVPWHVDTTLRSPDEVAAEVIALHRGDLRAWRVRTPTGSYPVLMGAGSLSHLGALLRARDVVGSVAVVSDEHVWPHYGERLMAGLAESGVPAAAVVLPAGEQHKTLATVSSLYDAFVEAGLTRSGAVVAMGGGVITDMAGFAASTYMRGVPVVPVPTTLLSMVDAGVGGKVAVDHPRGKNLVGAFVEPMLVLLDPEVLATLPEAEYRAGLAEIIKAGVIADPELFAAFEASEAAPPLNWLVERALQVKIDVVEEDPYERGRRAVLNLGHTFAHAFEVLADYRLHHGLAVSMGMAAAAHLAELRGRCSAETRERIVATLAAHDLPVTYDGAAPAEVYAAMGTDKKRRGSHLRFVLPGEIGRVMVEEAPEGEVLAALERTRGR